MNIEEKSAKLRTLMNDDTFKEVMEEIAEQQVAVFVNADSTTDELKGAHEIIRALRKIEDYFDSVLSDEAIHNKKKK